MNTQNLHFIQQTFLSSSLSELKRNKDFINLFQKSTDSIDVIFSLLDVDSILYKKDKELKEENDLFYKLINFIDFIIVKKKVNDDNAFIFIYKLFFFKDNLGKKMKFKFQKLFNKHCELITKHFDKNKEK